VRVIAPHLATISNVIVAFETLVAFIARLITNSTTRIHTAKNANTVNGSVSSVTHAADLLRTANITVIIITNKLAPTVNYFISFFAVNASVSIITAIYTFIISAIKKADLISDRGTDCEISCTEKLDIREVVRIKTSVIRGVRYALGGKQSAQV
jgi:hypothetical protein